MEEQHSDAYSTSQNSHFREQFLCMVVDLLDLAPGECLLHSVDEFLIFVINIVRFK